MNLVTDFYRHEERLRRKIRELLRVPGTALLDVGCRKGELTRMLATAERQVVAVDITSFDQWLEPAQRIRFVRADAMSLPFSDHSFDLVVAGECLQYVRDWRSALDEFHRVLKPGGRLVITCPNGSILTNFLDPYNLIHRFKTLARPSAVRDRSAVRHIPTRRILAHRPQAWRCEVFLRRGSLAFIYSACLVDQLQNWRAQLSRQFRTRSAIAETCLKPLIEFLFLVMKCDFGLSLGALSYNAIYRFRKK